MRTSIRGAVFDTTGRSRLNSWLSNSDVKIVNDLNDMLIHTCLAIRVLFKLLLRQTNDMAASQLKSAKPNWAVPNHSKHPEKAAASLCDLAAL
jgi:hypothetical protein